MGEIHQYLLDGVQKNLVTATGRRTLLKSRLELETISRNAVSQSRRALGRAGLDYLRYSLRISAWVRWFAVIAWLAQLHHQVNFAHPAYISHAFLALSLLGLNVYVLYRLEKKRTVTWRWVFALSAMDVVVLTGGLTISGGFDNTFFVLYYAALAMFAAVCTSLRVSFAGVTVVAAVYVALTLTVEPGGGLEIHEGKVLFTRITAMYAVVAAVSLVSRFEQIRARFDRARRREAVERERELQRERLELSQTIHDTIAQSAYMIGLGLETAIELAATKKDEDHDELLSKLKATLALSKSTMWELRHPIDIGAIFEGRELSRVLRSHASTFTTITSIPTELVQSGTEPPLPTVTRRLLFSIAHNAMTNALRHSNASKITIALSFEEDGIRMAVLDDGTGLPDDYADRGHGFRNMRTDAERMGGRLEASSTGESGRGTTVTCVIPYSAGRGGT